MHVAELQRLGAKINIQNNKALIEGNTKFIGAELMSSDLRASVALVLAAIVANGKSIVGRVYHLESCLLYTSPSPRDNLPSRMPSSA